MDFKIFPLESSPILKRLLAALLAAPLLLTACSDSKPDIHTLADLRKHIATTNWECTSWNEYGSGNSAVCGLPHNQGEVNVHISNDPELLVAYLFDNHPELEASVVGENWVYECSPPLGASDCPGLAELFGGESIER